MEHVYSPLMKQCFVTLGVTLNTLQQAWVMGFSSVLVPQLRAAKHIQLDDESQSWIASIHNISMVLGILIIPSIMGRFGRRLPNCLIALIMCLSWFTISICADLYSILLIKLIQGFCSGMIGILSPVTIGEYTSPKYRGAFLNTIALSIYFGALFLHALGFMISWQITARVFGCVTIVNFLIIFYSPETPHFLAFQKRFEECRKTFHWLRYSEERDTVEKLIKVNLNKPKMDEKTTNYNLVSRKFSLFMSMFKKKEFYLPIILMCHLHLINEWSGGTIYAAYNTEIYKGIVGTDVNITKLIISTDIQMLITNGVAVVFIKKFKRRVMLVWTASLNITVYLFIAGYIYAKIHYDFPDDSSILGITLIHLHAFSVAFGCLPLPNIISGEIFALEYRGISSMIALLFFVLNVFINCKTILLLISTIGLHGAYCICAGFVAYGLLISWIMLPETKDKTLLEIEETFRGSPLVIDDSVAEPVDFCLLRLSPDLEDKNSRM